MPSRRSPFLALVALAIAGCTDATSPSATSPNAPTRPSLAVVDNSKFPVTFELPAGTCGLTTTVTGTGVYHLVNRVSETRSGGLRVALSESAHGTATGADGSRYRFNYVANSKVIDVDDPTTLPIVLDLVDHFNLLGQGQTPDVRVYLRGQFLYDGTLPVTPIGDPVIRGGLDCDPI